MVARRHIVSRRKPYWLLNKYVYPSSSNSGPTHILSQSSSCIDLIFTDQPHLVIDCGIHASLHPSCHHQITYCKLNLKIIYPPPYKHLIWDYKKANSFCIKKALWTVNWDVLFHLKSVHEQVNVFNDVVNIFSNIVPNRIIEIDDRNPPWMNVFIKKNKNEKIVKQSSYTKIIEWMLISLTLRTYPKIYQN